MHNSRYDTQFFFHTFHISIFKQNEIQTNNDQIPDPLFIKTYAKYQCLYIKQQKNIKI